MATTEFNKEYLNYTKQEAKKWYLYLGGTPETLTDKPENVFNWGRDVNFLYKIRDKDVNFVTKRIDWEKRKASVPWGNSQTSQENRTVFNKNNNTVYICVSDNDKNRSDVNIRGKNPCLFLPDHTDGIKKYDDGYSWYPLFLVDTTSLNLITPDVVPVPTVEDYTDEPDDTSIAFKYTSVCGVSYMSVNGVCCLYNKTSYLDGIGVTQEKGNLSPVKFVSKCYQCYETAAKLDCDFKFYSGVTVSELYPSCTPCSCTNDVLSQIDKIKKDEKNINPNSATYFLYKSYNNWLPTKKGIFSIFINLDDLTDEQKIVSSENPTINFTSLSGSGASAKLKTEKINNVNYVTGIELVSSGSDYNVGDVKVSIDGDEGSILNKKIEVNITPSDFPEIPHVMLNNLKTCIKTNFDNEAIKKGSGTNINEFTRFGLIKDIKSSTTNLSPSDTLNKNEFQVLRTTTKLSLSATGSNNSFNSNSNLLLTKGTEVDIKGDTDKKGEIVYFKYFANSSSEVTGGNLEIITKDYDNIKIGDTIEIDDNFNYVVTGIDKPTVSFGAGTPLINKKTSLLLPNPDLSDYLPRKGVSITILKS
jgi:hypothetical protein